MIDYFALRAHQHDWLIRYAAQNEARKNLSQLPNWAYSLAIAEFYAARDAGDAGNFDKADELLQNALILFPGVLIPMMEKCAIESDKAVAGNRHFIDGQLV